MIFKSIKYFPYLRNKLICYLETIIGEREEFNVDHRFFNSICLIVAISYIIRILINLILGIKLLELTLSHIISFYSILYIFYVSRFLKKLEISKFLFLIVLLVTFSLNWFFTGGTTGVMLFYYFWLFAIIIFIFDRRYKLLVVCIIIINVTVLILLEYRFPHWMIQKIDDHKLSIYKYLHFLFISVLTALIIQLAKTLYRKEKFLNIALTGSNQNHDNGHEKKAEIINSLTLQERKVLELILNGKKNKEIAAILFIDICTVKTHINNIYKKIGINNRPGVLNLLKE